MGVFFVVSADVLIACNFSDAVDCSVDSIVVSPEWIGDDAPDFCDCGNTVDDVLSAAVLGSEEVCWLHSFRNGMSS